LFYCCYRFVTTNVGKPGSVTLSVVTSLSVSSLGFQSEMTVCLIVLIIMRMMIFGI